MGNLKNSILASLVIIALLAAAFLIWHSEMRKPGRTSSAIHTAIRPPIVPSNKVVVVTKPTPLPNQKTATRRAFQVLNLLAETGASDKAATEARGLIAQLDVTQQPFAKTMSAVLKPMLADQKGGGTIAGIPRDLVDRAAAASDAHRQRKPGEIVLSFAGDCTFGTVNSDDSSIRFPTIYRQSHELDYPFALVQPWFRNDDLTVVNFECTLTNGIQTADKQWHFKGPGKYALIFPAGSVELVGLSNNHSHDYLQAGLNDTVANFRKAHVPAFYQNVPYITTLQGIETVIIGDCTVVGENTTQIDGAPDRVLREIKYYKKPNNIVIVVMHWGSELDQTPRPWQQVLGRRFIDAGADAVVGHHPHVLQGIELYKGKYIAYSLGNFAFGGNSLAHFPDTFILRLRFHIDHGRTRVLPASIVPCWTTSSLVRNENGVLRNDYQAKPVFGTTEDRTVALVLARSAGLKYGVKKISFLRLP